MMKLKFHYHFYTVAALIVYTFVVWYLASIFESGKSSSGISNGKNCFSVEKRLKESEKNYVRALKGRRETELRSPLDETNKWSWKNDVCIWDFFYAPFDCPHTVERIGNTGDGGKWLCGINHLERKRTPCIVYSYGVSDEISFEEAILERTHCLVYMFDHTIDVSKIHLPTKYPGRAFIKQVGLGLEDGINVSTLKTQMKNNGHDFLDILKMDVEGAEKDVTNTWKNEFPQGLPFAQIAMEVHVNKEGDKGFYASIKKWFENLEAMGLRPFRNEYNLLGTRGGQPLFIEYSFVNIKSDNYLLHSN